MSRQDRQGVRLPADVERKWGFKKRFKETMDAANAASQSVKELDKKFDQAEIFDRLTNDGESQGVFMGDNGQIYINASYLVTGILKSLDGTTFYLDLVNGILKGQFTEFSISGKTVDAIAQEKADTAQQNAQTFAEGKAGEAQKNAEDYADAVGANSQAYADGAAKDAVDAQTQTDVFNKLTNNGTAQGIYYKDGELYINASYLAAGILKTLDQTTFYLDLASNILKIKGKTVSWKDNGDGTYTLVGN